MGATGVQRGEEAVVNAVYHRGYDVREPVEIRIMHDELVVLSYPGPDRSVRLEQLRAGKAMPRRYRNRRIGEFLKELEFTGGEVLEKYRGKIVEQFFPARGE